MSALAGRGCRHGAPALDKLLGPRVALLVCLCLTGCDSESAPGRGGSLVPEPAAPPVSEATLSFVDIAAAAGLDFQHHNGATGEFYYPELMQGGAALFDFDGDDRLDVYLVQSGPLPPRPGDPAHGNELFRNRGGGTFERVTARAGVADRRYGSGAAAADYDRDGDVDLYVTNLGRNTLLRNNGDGTFSDVTDSARVGDPGYSTSAAWFDADGDLDLDLYVANYLEWSTRVEKSCLGHHGLRGYCSPAEYEPQSDTLYRNDGGGRFTDISDRAGILAERSTGLGVVTADFDGDGRIDVYVANDQRPNVLWINQGDFRFRNDALLLGAALNGAGRAEAGMGVAIDDPDDDGDLDLFLTHLRGETNTYYRSNRSDSGAAGFRDVTDSLRLGAVSQPYTGFGTGFVDLDRDGRLDLFVANGKVSPGDTLEFAYAEPNQLLRGLGDGRYADVSAAAGPALTLEEVSRAAVFGDLDDDGDLDIVLNNNGGPARLLENRTVGAGHWLQVRLRSQASDRDVLGAVVRVEVGGRTLRREVRPQYGYCSSHDPVVDIGLGAIDRVDRLEVLWPSGARSVWSHLPVDRRIELTEP